MSHHRTNTGSTNRRPATRGRFRRLGTLLIKGVALSATAASLIALGTPAQAAEATRATAAPGADASCVSLDGCYGYAQMSEFYDQIIPMVDQFSSARYEGMSRPTYAYVPSGSTSPSACDTVDSTAFAYCSADQTIYIGQDQLWEFYSEQGDAAAGFGLAHEWGHHVQNMAGVLDSAESRQARIQVENQADCIAGSWVTFVAEQGQLERGDIDDIGAILQVIASAEGPERDHGTLQERAASAQLGLSSGLSTCNRFFSDVPVIT